MSNKARIILACVSVACWLVACCLPALNLLGKEHTSGEKSAMAGISAFFTAFFGMFTGQFAWLANPLGVTALILIAFRRDRVALFLSVLAILLAQQTWLLVGTEIMGDEGGVTKYLVTSLGIGFYLWVLSFAIIAVVAVGGMKGSR